MIKNIYYVLPNESERSEMRICCNKFKYSPTANSIATIKICEAFTELKNEVLLVRGILIVK